MSHDDRQHPSSKNQDAAPGSSNAAADEPTAARKPYARPVILSTEPLEAMAVKCSPSPPAKANPGMCPMGPISS